MNKLKSIFLYFYSCIAYLIVFFVVWSLSSLFLFPNIYSVMVRTFGVKDYGNEDTVIVSIDDKSIDEIRWPWNRSLYGKIIKYFDEYTEVKVLGLDLAFQGKSQGDEEFFNSVKDCNNKIVAAFLPSKLIYHDTEQGSLYEQNFYNKFRVDIGDSRTKINENLARQNSIVIFPDNYFSALKYTGSALNMQLFNGPQAQTLSLVDINNVLYPSLSLRMYMLANSIDKLNLQDNGLLLEKTGLFIPFYDNGKFSTFIKFYKMYDNTQYSHVKYSAIDIVKSYDNLKKGLPPIINPEIFKNKTVFFGMNSVNFSDISDYANSPISSIHPGVDIQATVYDNFVNKEFTHRISIKTELIIDFILSLLIFVLVLHLGLGTSLSIFLGIMTGYFVVSAAVLYPKNIANDVITPIIVCLATLIFGYAFKFVIENKNKEKVKNAMGKYISKDVMQNVVKNIDNVRLGGRKATVTVLFADIRGFTSMSEKMTAEEVSVILNEYFSAIEPIITSYNGVINKFIGDAVMAIFGDPVEDEMHPMNAVLCANEMLKRVQKLGYKWSMENKPEIEIGIGINTGEVFVGNIGSETRLEYTVIGDTVNIASRIESYNKVYHTKFLIGSSTYESVKNRVDVIKIGGVTIRGKQKKMDIYEILRVNKPE